MESSNASTFTCCCTLYQHKDLREKMYLRKQASPVFQLLDLFSWGGKKTQNQTPKNKQKPPTKPTWKLGWEINSVFLKPPCKSTHPSQWVCIHIYMHLRTSVSRENRKQIHFLTLKLKRNRRQKILRWLQLDSAPNSLREPISCSSNDFNYL